jgi:hypothetical protein
MRDTYGESILVSDLKLKKRSIGSTIGVTCTLLFASFGGCSKPKDPWEIMYPANGQVTFKGRPISDAELTFFPEDKSYPDSVRPKAKTTADGTFVAWTNAQGDGVPAGNYKVTIVHNEVSVSKDTIVAKPNDLPIKYSKRDTTDIQVQIASGKNAIPAIALK